MQRRVSAVSGIRVGISIEELVPTACVGTDVDGLWLLHAPSILRLWLDDGCGGTASLRHVQDTSTSSVRERVRALSCNAGSVMAEEDASVGMVPSSRSDAHMSPPVAREKESCFRLALRSHTESIQSR